MSFTQTKNKVGPRIVSLGTADVTVDQFENVSRIVTLCCLFFRKFLSHSNKGLSIPCRLSLSSRRTWGTLSNTFDRSKKNNVYCFRDSYVTIRDWDYKEK